MKVIKFGRTTVIVNNMTGMRPVYFKEKESYGIQFDTTGGKTYTAFIKNEDDRDDALRRLDEFLESDLNLLVIDTAINA